MSRSGRRSRLRSMVAGHAFDTGREAAGVRSLLSASVRKELVQRRGLASSTKLRLDGKLQKNAASARCGATEMKPLHRRSHAAWAKLRCTCLGKENLGVRPLY